jgi:hypothetical protein
VVQGTRLMFRDGSPTLVLSDMATMAGEKNCRISIQQTSGLRVQGPQHTKESVTDGLMCQTKVSVCLTAYREATAPGITSSGLPTTQK